MALINCPKCDKKISDTADKCIGCKHSFKTERIISKWKDEPTESDFKMEGNNTKKDKYEKKRLLINILLLIFILTSVIILIILMIDELPYISTSRVRGIDRLSEKISIWRTQVYACAYVLITALASLIYFNKR